VLLTSCLARFFPQLSDCAPTASNELQISLFAQVQLQKADAPSLSALEALSVDLLFAGVAPGAAVFFAT